MEIKRASKNSCKIKMAVQGPSGSGKTYSSLLIAYGLTGDWNKVCVIDTENGSANLYADLGSYSVLPLSAPFSPENYSQAIQTAVKAGFECIIIDSMSHEWCGTGGILDIHGNMSGNSFANWGKMTPRHNAFMQTVLQCDAHVIGTMRSKIEYVMQDKNGKQVPEKVGLKAVQRDDAEYEFTILFDINQKHNASVSKDRTGLFRSRPELTLTAETGREIAKWCNSGTNIQGNALPTSSPTATESPFVEDPTFEDLINGCKSLEELHKLFQEYPNEAENNLQLFIDRKKQLLTNSINLNGKH
jgi:hypothetical protein